jgi:hypothetical protein
MGPGRITEMQNALAWKRADGAGGHGGNREEARIEPLRQAQRGRQQR